MLTALPLQTQTAVARLHRPDPAVFDDLAAGRAQPVVLTGCLDDWPLMARLREAATPEAQASVLTSIIGRRKVRYTALAPDQHGQLGYTADGRANFSFASGGKVPFATFANVLCEAVRHPARGAVYMQSVPLGTFPELLPHVPELPYLAGGAAGYRQLWIGSGGHVVNLHFDPTHNLIAMLSGRKRITLVPPDNMANMYPAPLDSRLGDAIGSRVKLLEPDFTAFPNAAGELAKAQVAVLEPGEVLYVPPMWWHHVESFDLNVMLNKWVLPIAPGRFRDLAENLVSGILTFGRVPHELRMRYRAFCYPLLFGIEAPATGLRVTPGADVSALKDANRWVERAVNAVRDMPESLRATLPPLYDYYVFQVDGPPALAARDPERFARKLAWFARATRLLRAIQSGGRRG